MAYSALEKKHIEFQDYIQLITGRTVVTLDGQGAQLSKPYIATKVFSYDVLEHDVEKITDQVGSEEIVSDMRGLSKVEFQIQCYGGDSKSCLKRLKTSFFSSIFMDKLGTLGFGLSECSNIIDISTPLIGSKWEDRSQLSCMFYMSLSEEFVIDHFDKIDLTTKIEDKNYSNTITLPEQ